MAGKTLSAEINESSYGSPFRKRRVYSKLTTLAMPDLAGFTYSDDVRYLLR